MRVRLSPSSDAYLYMPIDLARANTPDSANLSITGDIDIRIDIMPSNWADGPGLANKYLSTGNQRSWAFYANLDGTITFRWSADGTTVITKTSTAAVSIPASGRIALRVVLDVNNGAAGNDVKFYTATDINGSWTQLGTTVTTAGTTSIFDSTANLEIGGSQGNGTGDDLAGRIYGFELRSGIAGTLKAQTIFANEAPGPGPFTDEQGNVWALVANASLVKPSVRFSGEISAFPPKWDETGRDVWVEMEAAGILRRLGQGATPLKSTLLRAYTTLTGSDVPKAYWPCEDGEDAKSIGSGLGGQSAMTITGSPDLASNTDFKCSQPIPVVGSSKWAGTVPTYAGTGAAQVWFLLSIPSGGTVNGSILVRVQTTGTIVTWDISWETGGNLRLRGYDGDSTLIEDSGGIAFGINGKPERISLTLQQNGGNIDWDLNGQALDGTVGGLGGSQAGTFTRIVGVRVNPNGAALDDVAIGQISVHGNIRDPFTFLQEFIAYAGETAGRRIERLCSEEGIAFRAMGNLDDSAGMGAQLPRKLIDLVREAAFTDGGILFEPRDFLGLAYRPRTSMYTQASALDLDYSAKHLSSFEPVEDDQQTRNDVTAQRVGGASARSVLESGTLSIQAPPNGVGTYDDEAEVNTFGDGILPSQASWRVFLGTVDESRYPVIELDLARAPFVASAALVLDVQDLDIGDRLTVTNLPAWLPPEDVSQLAQGFKETMSNYDHRVAINCSPASPWAEITSYDATGARYDSPATVTAEALDTTETGVDITVTGPKWSHADGDFDVMIDGERMTVTAITGTGPAQTFTVTRSVNGIVKSHNIGVSVNLADPVVYAL
jgi:hypothetical protein